MNLVPPFISRSVKLKDEQALEKQGVMTCMECGSCAFNCPAHKHIVQNMRLGKAIVKEAAAKRAAQGKG